MMNLIVYAGVCLFGGIAIYTPCHYDHCYYDDHIGTFCSDDTFTMPVHQELRPYTFYNSFVVSLYSLEGKGHISFRGYVKPLTYDMSICSLVNPSKDLVNALHLITTVHAHRVDFTTNLYCSGGVRFV